MRSSQPCLLSTDVRYVPVNILSVPFTCIINYFSAVKIITLTASCGKRNVMVWHPSVRLPRRRILNVTH